MRLLNIILSVVLTVASVVSLVYGQPYLALALVLMATFQFVTVIIIPRG